MIKHPLDLLAWKKKMRIYSHPNLHLNANVLGLAQNHGNEEHYSSGASILWLCSLPSQEQCGLPVQQLGEDWWAQSKSTPLCAFGMLSSFSGDTGVVMDQAAGWDLLGTSTTSARGHRSLCSFWAALLPASQSLPKAKVTKSCHPTKAVDPKKCWTLLSPPACARPSPTTQQPRHPRPIRLPAGNYKGRQLNRWLPATTHPVCLKTWQ